MTYNIHIKTNPPSPRAIHSHLKASAKKRNIPFDLSVYDVCNISLPVTCPILNTNRAKNNLSESELKIMEIKSGDIQDNI
jgi:hypothetical protein